MIKWKNRDMEELGIIVENAIVPSKAKKDIETKTIPGRNGFVTIDKGTYQPFVASLKCHAKETANFDDIKAYLDGYGTLSFDNQREYTAIVRNAIQFEKVLSFKKFAIEFMVNPIAHDIQATNYNATSGVDLTITGANAVMYPILTIVTSDQTTITINNIGFTLSEAGTYILDCENKVITDTNGNNLSSKMAGEFPELHNGANTIDFDTDCESLLISYKKAYL